MEQGYYQEYDEISLRELIESLVKHRKLIVGITLAFTILAVLVSLILPKKYEATAVLQVSPVSSNSLKLDGINNVIGSMSEYPEMTVETYLKQIKSAEVMDQTIKALDLKNEEGDYISLSSLSDSISVSNTKNTNLIEITVTSDEKEKAQMLANEVASQFITYISDNSRDKNLRIAKLIEEQLTKEEKNVHEKSQAIVNYLSDNIGVDELQQEVNAMSSQLTSLKSSKNNVLLTIDKNQKALNTLLSESGIKGVANVGNIDLELKGSNAQPSFQLGNVSPNSLQSTLLTMDITKLQSSLVQSRANLEAIDTQIERLQEELRAKQTLLEENKYKFDALNREKSLAIQAYNAYQQRHKEAMITAAADIGNSSASISSQAVLPERASAPNKKMIVAIAFVLGAMISVFLAFFIEYWKNSGEKSANKEIKSPAQL